VIRNVTNLCGSGMVETVVLMVLLPASIRSRHLGKYLHFVFLLSLCFLSVQIGLISNPSNESIMLSY
jgi:hypothetical protein